jgi:LysM repeat protein
MIHGFNTAGIFVINKYTLKMNALRIFMLVATLGLFQAIPATAQDNAYVNHTVKSGETLYSIARLYKIEVKDILTANHISDKEYKVKIGDILKIPVRNSDNTAETKKENTPLKEHHVMQGETLYKIAAMYNTTPEVIKQLNQLKSDGINIGQILKVPSDDNATEKSLPVSSTPAPPAVSTKPISENDVKDLSEMKSTYIQDYNANEATYFDKGIATWLEETDDATTSSRFYALHKTAPIGTILKIRNLMNNKIAYVKVVGKLPDIEENHNVIVKVSGATAKYLEVFDPKFLVEISYVNKKN